MKKKAAFTYYNKMGRNGGRNYLYIIGENTTALIGWQDMINGPDVLSFDRCFGKIDPSQKGYKPAEPSIVAAILSTHLHQVQELR